MHLSKKHKGAHSELIAVTWLLSEGYEVFRNVSSHGPIDIIAFRDGETLLLDVKSRAYMHGDGAAKPPRITPEQSVLGVKLLLVDINGRCTIIRNPLHTGEVTRTHCAKCFEVIPTIWKNKRQLCFACTG